MRGALALALALATSPLARADGAPPRIAVSVLRADGVDVRLGERLVDLLALELEKFEGVEVVSPGDVRAALDQAALNQLTGCDDPKCAFDASKLLAVDRLLVGGVGRVGDATVLSVALLDPHEGKVLQRVSQPLNGDLDDVTASLRTVALLLVTGDPRAAPAQVQVKGELTAELLERVRVAERDKGLAVRALGGGLLSMMFLADERAPPSNLGGAGRVEVDVPVLPWLLVGGGLGASYYTGKFVERRTFVSLDAAGDPKPAFGTSTANLGVTDLSGELSVKARQPYGLVLPYFRVAVSGDLLILDVSDLVFSQDADSPGDAPPLYTEPIPFSRSIAPGLSVRAGPGVDFMLFDHVGATVELNVARTFHLLEKIAYVDNVEVREPYPALTTLTLLVGVTWQL